MTGIGDVPLFLDLAATGAGALTGGLFAVQRNIPSTGLLAVTIVNGFGGGVLRDLLLGRTPPVALQHGRYLALVLVCAALCFFLGGIVGRVAHLVEYVDALGMALFATVGAATALRMGFGPLPAIMVGAVNAIGGGLLRDLISGVVPDIARPGPISAFAGVVAAVVFVVLRAGLDLGSVASQWSAITVGVVLRVVAIHTGAPAPVPVDLSTRFRRRRP